MFMFYLLRTSHESLLQFTVVKTLMDRDTVSGRKDIHDRLNEILHDKDVAAAIVHDIFRECERLTIG